MNQVFERLQPYLEKSNALDSALTLFDWDNETLAPKAAIGLTSKVIGVLAGELYKTLINDDVKGLLAELQAEEGLSEMENVILKDLCKSFEQLEKIPADEYQEYAELQSLAAGIWQEAKEAKDYAKFEECLGKLIDFNKRFAGYRAKDGQRLYDVLLDDYEEGITCEMLDEFFAKMKGEIVPLLRQVVAKNDDISKDFVYRTYPVEKQKEFCRFIVEYIGFDFDKGVMGESEHPFTTNMHNKDVRITNHYHENNLESAIFSIIHEGGHGMYEMGIADELMQTPAGQASSMGIHESQSRFYENIIGREEAFWEPIYGKLVEVFPDQLRDVSLESFFAAVNKAEPGLIRTEADELTYSLHVMIRYEIEKAIFDGTVSLGELPAMWNRLYKEYLGVVPEDDSVGILQDVHWSGGMFGYFPSYALGNAVAAQIYHQMKKDLPFEECLRNGDISRITAYLKEHIHQYGHLKNTNELLQGIMGEDFNADYYVDYLKEKYTRIYHL